MNHSQLYLWNDRTLYIGPIPHRSYLSLGAASLLVFLDGNATVNVAGQKAMAQTFLIPPVEYFEVLNHQGRVAILLLDSLGYEYHALKGTMMYQMENTNWHSMTEKAVVQTFRTIARSQYGAKDLYHWMLSLTRPEEYMLQSDFQHDERIEKTMSLIKTYGDTPLDIMDCAQQVGLTVAELEALFFQETKLTLKGFRAWRLLGDAITLIAEGKPFREAVTQAGFESMDQYYKVFVRHFGLHPSVLAKYTSETDVHIYKKPIASEELKESLYSAPDFFEFA